MKKFMKICAIVALGLLVLGLLFAVVAGSAVGRDTITNVTNTVTGGRITVQLDDWENWGIQIHNLFSDKLGDVEYNIDDAMMFDSKHEIMRNDVEKYRLEGSVTGLNLEIGGCEVEMVESEDSYFYVEAHRVDKFQGYIEDNTLNIRSSTGTKSININTNNKIIVYAPRDFLYQDVAIELGAGSLKFDKMDADQIKLEVGAGEICLNNVQADALDISVGMGEISLENMEVRKLSAQIGMGELKAVGGVTESLDAHCSMGSLNLTLRGKQTDYNYEIHSSMGSLDIGSESYSGLTSSKNIDNGASKKINVECSMGSTSIQFTE